MITPFPSTCPSSLSVSHPFLLPTSVPSTFHFPIVRGLARESYAGSRRSIFNEVRRSFQRSLRVLSFDGEEDGGVPITAAMRDAEAGSEVIWVGEVKKRAL